MASIAISTHNVKVTQAKYPIHTTKNVAALECMARPIIMVFSRNTADNYPWASERAQRRR